MATAWTASAIDQTKSTAEKASRMSQNTSHDNRMQIMAI